MKRATVCFDTLQVFLSIRLLNARKTVLRVRHVDFQLLNHHHPQSAAVRLHVPGLVERVVHGLFERRGTIYIHRCAAQSESQRALFKARKEAPNIPLDALWCVTPCNPQKAPQTVSAMPSWRPERDKTEALTHVSTIHHPPYSYSTAADLNGPSRSIAAAKQTHATSLYSEAFAATPNSCDSGKR